MTDDEIERVLDKGIVKLTQNTPDRQLLMKQLSAIRKSGYAVSFGERVDDGIGISVPVYNATQTVVASLTGPCHRLTEQRINDLLPQVIDMGKKISLELGFNDNLGVVLGKKNLNEIAAGEQL
jgi:DNA-binding IclR family transcriptional regulator